MVQHQRIGLAREERMQKYISTFWQGGVSCTWVKGKWSSNPKQVATTATWYDMHKRSVSIVIEKFTFVKFTVVQVQFCYSSIELYELYSLATFKPDLFLLASRGY